MDWRISIRGIWDIQGRDKGKKKKHPPSSNGWWIITSRERKKERKSRWMKVNISPSCFFSWIDKGSAERSRHLRAFGLEKNWTQSDSQGRQWCTGLSNKEKWVAQLSWARTICTRAYQSIQFPSTVNQKSSNCLIGQHNRKRFRTAHILWLGDFNLII
jgi:hypothetical protein